MKITFWRVPNSSGPFVSMIAACLLATGWPPPARSEPLLDNPAIWRLLSAAPSDPRERLALTEDAIAELDAAGVSDPALEIDLLRMKSSALIALGRPSEAARLFERKAAIAEAHGLTIAHDPVALYDRAQDLHASLGRADSAARAKRASNTLRANRGRAARESPSRAPGKSEVRLLYATDRARGDETDPVNFYLSERGSLELGEVRVSIPPNHRRGQIEAPSLLRLEFGTNPTAHVVLDSVVPLGPAEFDATLDEALSGARAREFLVYIHGYNVSFDAAMRRAGQLAYDLQYDGVPIVYSWPSHGTTFGYISDTATVRHSARHLAQFLKFLATRHRDDMIHVIAHSMGNVALTDALELLALQLDRDGVGLPVFNEVVFAAPDVDAGLFASMAGTFQPLAERMTVYASSEDLALSVSRRLHGDAPRMGQGGDAMVAVAGIESIDMSTAGDDLLAHDYFAENWTALVDILTLIWRDTPPERRCGLERVETPSGAAWRMEADACSDRSLVDILIDLKSMGATSPEVASSYLDWRQQRVGVSEQAREFIRSLFAEDG